MTLNETEQGRMTLWDKCLTSALNAGKDVHEAIQWAETAVKAFEDRFHRLEEDVKHALDNHAS